MFWGFFWELTFSSLLPHFEQKNELSFGGKLSVSLSNCYDYRGTFWRKVFLENTNFLLRSIDFEPNFCNFWQKQFSRFVRTAVYVNRGAFWYFDIVFWQSEYFFMIFRLYLQKIIQIGGKILTSLSKLQIGCPGEEFKGKYFLKKIKVPHLFRILSENISDFWQKIFSRAFKTAVYVYRGTFQYCFS